MYVHFCVSVGVYMCEREREETNRVEQGRQTDTRGGQRSEVRGQLPEAAALLPPFFLLQDLIPGRRLEHKFPYQLSHPIPLLTKALIQT